MNGVGAACASSSAFQAAASIAGRVVVDPDNISSASCGFSLRHSGADIVKVAIAQINATVGDLAGNARPDRAGGARGACAGRPRGAGARTGAHRLSARRPAAAAGLHAGLRRDAGGAGARNWRIWRACIWWWAIRISFDGQADVRSQVDGRAAALQCRLGAEPAGASLGTYCKRELPNYQVFDERRYFVSGRDAGLPPLVFEVGGLRFGVLICEDAWFDEPAQAAVAAGAQLLCVLNASPFHLDKAGEREARMGERARAVGSAAALFAPGGRAGRGGVRRRLVRRRCTAAASPRARRRLRGRHADAGPGRRRHAARARSRPVPELEAQAWAALVTGVRDYLGKNGFPGAIIGLSGGIDSALVLAIAVDALGADRVRAVMMPSPYTADISWLDAREMARAAGRALRRDRRSARCSTPSAPAWRRSSPACPRTRPRRTCRRASAARC